MPAIEQQNRESRVYPRNRVWVLPAAIIVIVFTTGACIQAVPGAWLFVAVPLVLGAPVLVAIGVAGVAGCMLRRRWRLLAQLMLACLGLFALCCVPSSAESASHFVTSAMRVAVYRTDLQRQFEASKQAGNTPAIASITLDGFGSMADGIAFDPTGEIALPEAQQSKAWKAAASNTEMGFTGIEVQHIFGAYYSWFHY